MQTELKFQVYDHGQDRTVTVRETAILKEKPLVKCIKDKLFDEIHTTASTLHVAQPPV